MTLCEFPHSTLETMKTLHRPIDLAHKPMLRWQQVGPRVMSVCWTEDDLEGDV